MPETNGQDRKPSAQSGGFLADWFSLDPVAYGRTLREIVADPASIAARVQSRNWEGGAEPRPFLLTSLGLAGLVIWLSEGAKGELKVPNPFTDAGLIGFAIFFLLPFVGILSLLMRGFRSSHSIGFGTAMSAIFTMAAMCLGACLALATPVLLINTAFGGNPAGPVETLPALLAFPFTAAGFYVMLVAFPRMLGAFNNRSSRFSLLATVASLACALVVLVALHHSGANS
jgi:hypothetical protein